MPTHERRTVALSEATFDQLRAHAREYTGINYPSNTKRDTIIDALRKADWQHDYILVYDEEAPSSGNADDEPVDVATESATSAIARTSSKNDPVVILRVNAQEGPGGDRPVPVGVNANFMLIPREKDVPVPYRYYLALKAAEATIFEQDENSGEITERKVLRYPFNVIEPAPRDEVERWYAAQGAMMPGRAA